MEIGEPQRTITVPAPVPQKTPVPMPVVVPKKEPAKV
jgi:hypothetical protein